MTISESLSAWEKSSLATGCNKELLVCGVGSGGFNVTLLHIKFSSLEVVMMGKLMG